MSNGFKHKTIPMIGIFVANYAGESISCLRLPDNDLLLKTQDVCRILGISNRPAGSALDQPCLDLASAINLASPDDQFAMWLTETFAGYNPETLVHPQCDDDWNIENHAAGQILEPGGGELVS